LKDIKLIEHKKIKICCEDEIRSIEIGQKSINHGFLKNLPGPSLPVFLYILANLNNNNIIKTNPAIMAGFLALSREKIIEGINMLKDNKYINIKKKSDGYYRYIIKINLNKLVNTCYFNNYKNKNENLISYRKKILNESDLTNSDYKKALISFLPDEVEHSLFEEEMECWLNDFEAKLIKELVRRTYKWVNKNNKNKKEGFYYLHGIVDDWYSKEIFDYERLKYFDKLYRETNELAKCYGFKNWHNINKAQMEIFHSWLNDKDGLSLTIAKYAIKEAFRKKSDGQPSLKYIEDNFIIPLKENNTKSKSQAKKILNNNSYQKNSSENNSHKETNSWEKFEWDMEDLN